MGTGEQAYHGDTIDSDQGVGLISYRVGMLMVRPSEAGSLVLEAP